MQWPGLFYAAVLPGRQAVPVKRSDEEARNRLLGRRAVDGFADQRRDRGDADVRGLLNGFGRLDRVGDHQFLQHGVADAGDGAAREDAMGDVGDDRLRAMRQQRLGGVAQRAARIDDIVDSGGTLCNAAEALLKNGATSVTAYITHGVLSGGAVARVTSSKLKELVITDTIQPTTAVQSAHNIRVISTSSLIGEAINRTSQEESVSSLFD